MCGICGIISTKIGKIERDAAAEKMNAALFHRGPDEDGFYTDTQCSLAMRRLSIIDLNTGKQPLYNNLRTALIFFNGEIYNYKDLKIDLVDKGFHFDTGSDTEVIINLYQCYGISMLTMLKGMFAFCIYDVIKSEYLFARDRFGEKPFFYYHDSNSFFFSSELNSLLAYDGISKRLNRSVLGTYLKRSYVPEPNTLYADIKTLQPGHYLLYKENKIEISSYFTIRYQTDASIKTIDDAASFVKPYLENAIKRQMISDVPLGAFLSGGIDSSTVVALMQRFSAKPIKSFNVKFQTDGYDESKIARKVAHRIGTEHHEIFVENSSFKQEDFWKILKHAGIPFPDSSAIPTDLVTKSIVKYVKVALSGDGGDELFGGYNIFDWFVSIKKLDRVPFAARKIISGFISLINKRGLGNNKLRQIVKAIDVSRLNSLELLHEMHALFDSKELKDLYISNETVIDKSGEEFEELSDIRKAMYYRITYDLPLDMLVKVDRMSMSNSLEVRSPFLDPDLFEASARIPDKFLRANGIGKLVLRQLMKDELPEEVFNHPKMGFSIPLHDFRNDEFKKLAEDLLLNQKYMYEIFDARGLKNIYEEGVNAYMDSGSGSIYRKTHQLWSLMMLSGWIKMYDVEI